MNASPGTTRDENGFPIYCRPDRQCPDCRSKSGRPLKPVSSRKRHQEEPVAPIVSRGYRGATCAWCGGPRSTGQTLCSRCEPYKHHLNILMEHDRTR